MIRDGIKVPMDHFYPIRDGFYPIRDHLKTTDIGFACRAATHRTARGLCVGIRFELKALPSPLG